MRGGDPARPPAFEPGPARRGRLTTGIDAWLVTRYDEVAAGLGDARLVMSAPAIEAELVARGELPQRFGSMFQRRTKSLLSTDPPDHTRLRKLVARSFTARRVEDLRPRAEKVCAELADAMAASSGQPVDLVGAYAFPLPVLMICELLGVPADDREQFRTWTNAIVFDQGDKASMDAYRTAVASLDSYFGVLVEKKRSDPGDDLTSALVAEDQLEPDELRMMLSLLLVAGHETTVNLIGNSVLTLLRNPYQLALLRANPSLVPAAVDECLRLAGPVAFSSMRFATTDIPLPDMTIPAGSVVALGLWTADHDPTHFPQPYRFDITRTGNSHLAFGRGVHFCVGAPLARMEAEVAIGTLLRRFTSLALAVPETELVWRPANTRGPVRLPMYLTGRPTASV
ncbi:cytochrome P450 [Actinocrispum sp. NPDC049592]|uniref:cytochrome P450 family protein n=1 Tax=Actinocrispum sp. NPDC049592 TaxID=3154835 RepID=UPI003441806A